jgi:hypothetical protein
MSKKGLDATVYVIDTLPNTASELLEAVYKQKDLSRTEAREMAQYLDIRYGMTDMVSLTTEIYGSLMDIGSKVKLQGFGEELDGSEATIRRIE